MYSLLTTIEKGVTAIKTVSKISYYKAKYGKRLKIGKGVHFRRGFIINISKNGSLSIGDNTFFNNHCSINCHNKITIGKDNLFGEGVKIYDHNHIFNDKTVDIKRNFNSRAVTIGNRNWFGSNVVILSRAKIGNNNVFAANIVINSEYGSDTIVKASGTNAVEKICFKDAKNE